MHVPRRMLLRLEERIKVPERGLHKLVGAHLLEAHLEEDFPKLRAHLHEWVEVPGARVLTHGIEVGRLEDVILPRALRQHLRGEVGRLLRAAQGQASVAGVNPRVPVRRAAPRGASHGPVGAPVPKVGPRREPEALDDVGSDELALLEHVNFRFGHLVELARDDEAQRRLHRVLHGLLDPHQTSSLLSLLSPDGTGGHGLSLALRHPVAEQGLELGFKDATLGRDGGEDAGLDAPVLCKVLPIRGWGHDHALRHCLAQPPNHGGADVSPPLPPP